MLSTRTRYSIIALAELGRQSPGRPVPLSDIAARFDISLCYLEQLAAKWRQGDLVKAVRGPRGGYTLKRPPQKIRVSDIAAAVGEAVASTEESEEVVMARDAGCPAQGVCDLVQGEVRRVLSTVTLADIIADRIPTAGPRRISGLGSPDLSDQPAA